MDNENKNNSTSSGTPSNNNKKPPVKFKFNLYWVYASIAILMVFLWLSNDMNISGKKDWSEFDQMLRNGYIEKIVAHKSKTELDAFILKEHIKDVFPDSSNKSSQPAKITIGYSSNEFLGNYLNDLKEEKGIEPKIVWEPGNDGFMNILYTFGPILLFVGLWIFMMRKMSGGVGGSGGGVFNVGKSKAQLFDKDNENKKTFKDVAGLAEAKEEVQEIVEFLKNPSRYTDLGGKIPKGALLVGPPGTGKTLLAKAVAGEANVPFFSLSGSDFVEMFVGVGASRVRDLFKQAKEKAPCIVFIDEIDAVGRARGKNPNMGSNDERENTLNQLLTEMDGFGSNSGVIILAATNRADILDKALLRAGRFDRQITVELPDLTERKEIFQVHLRPIKIASDVDVELLARQTPGFAGADIANVCNEAALIAARRNKKFVEKQDFMDAVDRIIGGLEKKNKITTVEEKRTIAIHEAGHATLSWFLEFANPLVKVTIVPRGKALGAAWYLPEERQITTREQMLDQMCATLGGRAAEDVCIGKVSSGAMNDLERTTKQAYGMVAYLGLSEKLPNLCYYNAQDEFAFNKPYSEKTAELIDEEVKSLINEQYERAKEMLIKHKECHKQLADLLVEREVIYAEDLERLFGKRQWASRTEEILSLNEENLREINNEHKSAEDSSSEENADSNSDETENQAKTSNLTDH
ncbi:MAG: ATP-dependent zinc metalloprotease FtsH [Bacteroidales bacterium]|jgi:cell division protease FtsH|nr:ATP-dependent zinc metalloprotease FtsH [Bacteroidales bacterium]